MGKGRRSSQALQPEKLLLAVEKIVGVGMVWCLILLTALQVLSRYVFHSPVGWTEEGARYVFVWTIFFGSAVAARRRKHIKVELLVSRLSKRALLVVRAFVDLCTASFLVIMIPPAVGYALYARKLIAVAVRVPLFYVYISLPVGFSIMAVFYLIHFINGVSAMLSKRQLDETGDLT